MKRLLIPIAAVAMVLSGAAHSEAPDPLPSWNDGPTKGAIVGFVEKVTKEGGPDYVPPTDRIATSTMTVRCGWRSRPTRN